MLRQIKYHPNHISKMQANCMHGDDWFNKYDILEISKFGGVRTVIDENDDIVAIIGVQVKEDVGIVWVSPSSIVSKHGLSFARLIKQHIERI
ncbi:MAG: hypothetical protein IIB07_06935 [Bacteroidetes bacterium]|nr:hypothetical protein [Bacteroidota bacterium]